MYLSYLYLPFLLLPYLYMTSFTHALLGTAREAVVEDYMSKMHAAIDESERSAAVALSALAFGGAHNVVSLGAADPEINVETQLPGAVFAYNSLAWTRNTVVKIKLVGSLPYVVDVILMLFGVF